MQLDELIITMYCQVDDFVKANFPARRLRQRGPLPHLADGEVITMELVGEYLTDSGDSGFWILDMDSGDT